MHTLTKNAQKIHTSIGPHSWPGVRTIIDPKQDPIIPLGITFEYIFDLSVIKPASKSVKCSTKGTK